MPKRPPSTIRTDGDVSYISLKDGFEAMIDTADIHLVTGKRWRLLTTKKRNRYACTGQTRDGNFTTLHRHLVKPPSDLKVDHEDGDGLNNRRKNIRIATTAQNNANCTRKSKLGVKGVRIVNISKKMFKAEIRSNGKSRHIGHYPTVNEASSAYIAAARELWGDFVKK